ncbi:MAG: multicopper oxidase domain-containing protein [Methylococcales bacterium]|nr:multicopper oxidase domain-containing protein [Methylococcales bacterium]
MLIRLLLVAALTGLMSGLAQADLTHTIRLKAAKLDSGQLAYQMLKHTTKDEKGKTQDLTSWYSKEPSIPGPTLVFTEGDTIEITLEHGIEGSSQPVSLHVHGVHYKIDSDGTVKKLNKVNDQAAFPGKPYTYKWDAAVGTAGAWPYHDHTHGNPLLGDEDKGLYGALIVNPKQGKVDALIDGKVTSVPVKDITRDFVLWMHETTFWGQEVNHLAKRQIPLWTNPTLGAREGDLVRFHVIGIGTAFHTFHLHAHRWIKPGTTNIVDTVLIGPIQRESFVVKAGEGVGPGHWHYHCHVLQHMQSGMMGSFLVL